MSDLSAKRSRHAVPTFHQRVLERPQRLDGRPDRDGPGLGERGDRIDQRGFGVRFGNGRGGRRFGVLDQRHAARDQFEGIGGPGERVHAGGGRAHQAIRHGRGGRAMGRGLDGGQRHGGGKGRERKSRDEKGARKHGGIIGG